MQQHIFRNSDDPLELLEDTRVLLAIIGYLLYLLGTTVLFDAGLMRRFRRTGHSFRAIWHDDGAVALSPCSATRSES